MTRVQGLGRDFLNQLFGMLAGKLKAFLLVAALAGCGIAAFVIGSQAYAALAYSPATATILKTTWYCASSGERLKACSEADFLMFREDGRKTEFRVTFSFQDAQGRTHTLTRYIPKTGLRREDARPGVTFALLYDPADPESTELPLGSDFHSSMIGLVGIAALGLYLGIFWPQSWSRRRRAFT